MTKTIGHLSDKLMNKNIHPEIWNDLGDSRYPACELGYFRCDHDGHTWWNKVFPVNNSLYSKALGDEFDMVYKSFTKSFKDRHAMAKWCNICAEPTADDTEFNAYLELNHGYYWFRMITRRGDYNLYLHCYDRREMK